MLNERRHEENYNQWHGFSRKFNYMGLREIYLLLAVFNESARNEFLESKEKRHPHVITKCRHDASTFMISVQTTKSLIKNVKGQASDVVIRTAIRAEEYGDPGKCVQFSQNHENTRRSESIEFPI
jgi:hypothetical protein